MCQNLGATDDLTQAKVKKHINRALIRFEEMGEWSWQRVYAADFQTPSNVTVNGTAVYSVPNCLRINALYMQTPIQRKLTLLDDRNFRRMYPNDTATGTPYYYRQAGRANASSSALDTLKIGLYPIPDGAYALKWDGVRRIVLLSSDTDDVRLLTGMPVNLIDILIEMATAIAWKEIDDGDASAQMQEVMVRLKAAWSNDNHDIEDVMVMAPFEGVDLDKLGDPVLPPNYGE